MQLMRLITAAWHDFLIHLNCDALVGQLQLFKQSGHCLWRNHGSLFTIDKNSCDFGIAHTKTGAINECPILLRSAMKRTWVQFEPCYNDSTWAIMRLRMAASGRRPNPAAMLSTMW